MATFQIFEHTLNQNNIEGGNTSTFEVWVADGLVQYVIDGEIRHDIETINDFLLEAALYINKGNDENVGNFEVNGAGNIIDEDSLENYDSADGVVFEQNGAAPAISVQDDGTEVKFSGTNINSNFRIDFGTGDAAVAEAATFMEFADDLLGKSEAVKLASFTNVGLSGLQNLTISQRVDDIKKVQFKDTGDTRQDSWADAFIDQLGADLGGTKENDGKVSETGYTANQLNIDGMTVGLGPSGVGGKEVWEFTSEADAQAFFDTIKEAFGEGDRRDIINSAIEGLAEDLGGMQTKNGKVSTSYEARQIGLFGEELNNVTLGSHRVGGKETYEFADQETAQKFIDAVRDLVGVEGKAGKLVDDFVFKVSGLGVSGTETILGKDAFIEYMGEDVYGGELIRDGGVSESFNGASQQMEVITDSGTKYDVKLGPSGVGGKEVWRFDDEETADAFALALEDYML